MNKTYHLTTTINYPEEEKEQIGGPWDMDQLQAAIRQIIEAETEATSFVFIVT